MHRLEYDPETGIFVRRVTVRQFKAGTESGCYAKSGYVIVCIDGKNYMAHVLAWLYMTGGWPDGEIDHINGSGIDNRFSNLRDVPTFINSQNKHSARSDSSVGLLGVCKNRSRFTARIKLLGKMKNLGTFATAKEAHDVYVAAKRELHEGCTI